MQGDSPAEGQFTYEFVASHLPEAKATIGDKADGKWPVLWAKGDQMGVYKADGTFVGVADVSDESEGQNRGSFKVTSDVALSAGDNLYFAYPYVADAAISTGKVAAEQTLGASGVGANAIAYATAQFNPGNTQFVLTHANAYLKFNIKSEEFAGYNLTGVTLWADGAELAGSVKIADGGALTVSASEDYVKSTLAAPVAVSESKAQAVYVAALPVDLSAKTVYAIVHMKGVEGTETATHTVELPIRLNGAKALNAGAVTEINLPSLAKSLAPKWYEPVETRYVAAYGKGWSYGPENTVRFTSYTVEQKVELKARGNFMKVTEPKYVQIKYVTATDDVTTGTIHINGTLAAQGYIKNKVDESISDPIEITASDYSVNVKLNNYRYLSGAKGGISGMLVMDKNKDVIWGTNLWLTMVDITTAKYDACEKYGAGEVIDRNIGTDELGNINSWRPSGAFFQWGRPFAIQGNGNATSRRNFTSDDATKVTSLDVSAENPFTLYYYTSSDNLDWYYGTGSSGRENDLDDLWGNPNTGTTTNVYVRGTKSIYDPCPKGYMVVCPTIIKEVEDNYKTDGTGLTVLNATDYPYFTYKGIHWLFAGGYLSSQSISWKSVGSFCGYWSNSHIGNSGHGRSMEWASKTATSWGRSRSKAAAFPVRCMVDTENR